MYSFNRAMVMKQAGRASVRPGAGTESYLKQTPTVLSDSRPRAMGESDLRSLLATQAPVDDGESLADTSEETEDGFAAFRAQQNAAMMNRASVQVQPKKSGERRYKKLFRMAEEQRLAEKAQREAATAGLFDELPGSDAGFSEDEAGALAAGRRDAAESGLAEAQSRSAFAGLPGSDAGFSEDEAGALAAGRANAAKTGLMEAQSRSAFAVLPGSDAGFSEDEAGALAAGRRDAAKTGLAEAQSRSAFGGLPGSDAAFSEDEREDIAAEARRDAIANWQANRKPSEPAPTGVPLMEGLDNDALGLGLRSAFRSEGKSAGILTGGRKRGGIRWAGGEADPDAPAERVKHFEYTDPATQVAQEEEFTGQAMRDGDGNPAAYSASLPDAEASMNARQRKYQLTEMVMSMPRSEIQDNIYAQDIASPDLLQNSKSGMSNEESDAFWNESVAARRMQNQALGKRGYSTEDRKGVARTGNGGKGFLNSLVGFLNLGKIFGTQRDRTFDAAPNVRPRMNRPKPRSLFQRLFGTSRRAGQA